MEGAAQKIFYVHEDARAQIPKHIKVFKTEPGSPDDLSDKVKWTKEFTTYKLKSALPAKGYNKGILEVVYEITT